MKKKVLIAFKTNGENGGPYVSHERIMKSSLAEKYDFIPFFIPKARNFVRPRTFIRLVKEIRSRGADIIHIPGLQLDGFLLILLAIFSRQQGKIIAIRGSSSEAAQKSFLSRIVINFLEPFSLRHCDISYGVSDYVGTLPVVARWSKRYFGTIYNFFDFTHAIPFSEQREYRARVRAELKIPDKKRVVISTGRITAEKGFRDLAEIIKEDENEDVVFLIVGDGNYRAEMEAQLNRQITERRVLFLGYRNDVTALLNASDVFILCTWHETFGNSVVEASACGLPVVASNVGGIPEIVRDGVTGFLSSPRNIEAFRKSLNLLISNSQFARDMGHAGLEYVMEKFAKQKIENRIDELYQAVLRETSE